MNENCFKKVLLLSFLVVNYSLLSGDPGKQIQNDIFIESFFEQIKSLCPHIVEILSELFNHYDYWKTQELTPFSYFLSKDPTKWIFRDREWKKLMFDCNFLKMSRTIMPFI